MNELKQNAICDKPRQIFQFEYEKEWLHGE